MNFTNGNTPLDMAALAARAVAYRPVQMTPRQTREIAQCRRAERVVVSCPTVMDAEEPGTRAALEALRMATHAMAACLERHTGEPVSARVALNEAKGILTTYLRHYMHESQQQDGDQ